MLLRNYQKESSPKINDSFSSDKINSHKVGLYLFLKVWKTLSTLSTNLKRSVCSNELWRQMQITTALSNEIYRRRAAERCIYTGRLPVGTSVSAWDVKAWAWGSKITHEAHTIINNSKIITFKNTRKKTRQWHFFKIKNCPSQNLSNFHKSKNEH